MVAALFFLFAIPSFSQDNRPINNKRQIRETRVKSVKRKEKASTKDIAGRRLRTRNFSTAARAVESSRSPYKASRRSGDQAGRPLGGNAPRVRSRSAETARANVYPQKGRFVNNSSRSQRAYSNRKQVSKAARLGTRPNPPGKKRVAPRSGSQAFITRGRKNVYWGKYSKGERAITKDVAGRPLRTKNFRSPANVLLKAKDPYRGRKQTGDRAYSGTQRSGFATASRRGELPWKGDISGNAIRRRQGRQNEVAGRKGSGPRTSPGRGARLMKKDLGGLRGIKTRKSGGGSVSGQNNSNRSLTPKPPGRGADYMRKDQGKLRGIKPVKGGGGSISARMHRPSNSSLGAKAPGNLRVANMQGNYRGSIKRTQQGGFGKQGLNYAGNLKSRRQQKGGGSISGGWNNRNQPIAGRSTPTRAGRFQGNIKNQGPRAFSQVGYDYSGNVKSRRPDKGGGSISGSWNNSNQPIIGKSNPTRAGKFQGNIKRTGPKSYSQVGYDYSGNIRQRGPKSFSQVGYDYSGNMKSRRVPKGGGSISGAWNNKGQPIVGRSTPSRAGKFQGNIRQRGPKSFSQVGYNYSGNIKSSRPDKGGGSISGSWNNRGEPIVGRSTPTRAGKFQGNIRQRGPKSFSQVGYDYTGNMKSKRPDKGGGSISGSWNNKEQPIAGRSVPTKAGKFQGNMKSKRPDKGGGSITRSWNNKEQPIAGRSVPTKAGKFQGNMKGKKPEKGGGSVSGKLSNNDGKPLPPRIPAGKQAGDVNYSGRMKDKRGYERNPSASKEALKQRTRNRETVKASQYARGMKVYWDYKHNPSSADDAQKTIKYSKSFDRATSFAGKTRLTRDYRHSPKAHKDALKQIGPSRATARAADYQGNIKMNKFNHKKHFPDATFAHSKDNNVKHERTIKTNFKLFWGKVFKKHSMQPPAVKEKVRRPKYDKKEKELWKDLYD